jgi:hypothetical protein
MKPVIDPHASSDWINARQSCLLMNCSPCALHRAAALGFIQIRLNPGYPPVYSRFDVEHYAKQKAAKVPRKKKPRASCKTGEVISDSRVSARAPKRTNETLKGRASS